MHSLRKFIAATVCFALIVPALLPTFASTDEYKVVYDGGSFFGVSAGTGLTLKMAQNQIHFFKGKDQILTIPASSILEISYGPQVDQRIGAAIGLTAIVFGAGTLVPSISKKRFIGIMWTDGDLKGGLSIQCNTNSYRGILATLQGATGKTAVDSEILTVKN